MRSGFKRMLAVMLMAAMTTIPTFSSLAAGADVPEFSPFAGFEGIDPASVPGDIFDTLSPFWPGFSFGMASPSNMIPGMIPGYIPDMGQSLWDVPEEPLFPDMVPPADMEDAYGMDDTYDMYVEDKEADTDVTAQDTETEDDIYVTEDDTWTIVEDEDSGNGDYVKPQAYNIDGMISSDALLTQYIDRLFYGEPDTTIFTDYWRSVLNNNGQNFYDDVKEFMQEIAAADEIYPVFDAAGAVPSVRLTKAQLGLTDDTGNIAWCEAALDYYIKNVLNVSRVVNYLYRDDPACFYWTDRSYVVLYGAVIEDDYCTVAPSSICFPPQSDREGEYAGRIGSYEIVNVDNEDILTAARAAENAWEIVEDHLEEPENEMMASFGEAISGMITYDSEKDANSSDYDDPWMLVYVFDKDPLTTVTDIAYDKALLCLREMSGIDDDEADAE